MPITSWRHQVCLENGAESNYLDLEIEKSVLKKEYQSLPEKNVEEIFKYGNWKWKRTDFDILEVFQQDDQVVGLSGAKVVNGWLRTGMHLYTLKKYRKIYRSLFFKPEGFLERHVEFARNLNLKGVYYSIYPHNRALKTFINYMLETDRSLSPNSPLGSTIKDSIYAGGPYKYNEVGQHFFYIPLQSENKFHPEQVGGEQWLTK